MSDLNLLSKNELEALGREKGIELDRRLLKSKMVNQLQTFIDSLPAEEEVEEEVVEEISNDISALENINLDQLLSLAEGYGIDTSNIATKGELISSLISKL